MSRKIKRQMLKNEIGNNNIRREWRHYQITRLGMNLWLTLWNSCVAKSRAMRKGKSNAYVM